VAFVAVNPPGATLMPPKKPAVPVNATAVLPALEPDQARSASEGFIGHEAPTRVDIDLRQLGLLEVEKTAVGPAPVNATALLPSHGEAADEVTPLPEEGPPLTVAFLEELGGGVPWPSRLSAFFEREALRARHPEFEGRDLHFLTSRLEALFQQASNSGLEAPSSALAPVAAVGDEARLLLVDLERPALPVFSFCLDDGYVQVSAGFDDFVAALRPA
jgi:hypothetical protein